MQKNNRSLSKSAAFLLVAILAFLNASCSSKISITGNLLIPPVAPSSNDNIQPLIIGVLPTKSLEEQQRMVDRLERYLEESLKTQSAGYTSVQDADYTPTRKLQAKLSLKSERVQ